MENLGRVILPLCIFYLWFSVGDVTVRSDWGGIFDCQSQTTVRSVTEGKNPRLMFLHRTPENICRSSLPETVVWRTREREGRWWEYTFKFGNKKAWFGTSKVLLQALRGRECGDFQVSGRMRFLPRSAGVRLARGGDCSLTEPWAWSSTCSCTTNCQTDIIGTIRITRTDIIFTNSYTNILKSKWTSKNCGVKLQCSLNYTMKQRWVNKYLLRRCVWSWHGKQLWTVWIRCFQMV